MQISDFFPLWGKLTHEQQTRLTDHAVLRKAAKGTVLYNGSKDCAGLILVMSGLLRAYILSSDGREVTIYRLFERDICLFSASCIMRSIQFEIAVEAEKESEICVIPSDIYRQVMEESAQLANFTNEIMATRFSEVVWLMEQVMWKSFDKRLANFLLEEAAIEGSRILNITHETIGHHLGNPREVVTRMLKYFVSEGYVKLSRGTVEIVHPEGLRRIAE